METEWYIYPLVIIAGILAGIINTLAGNGSAITLSTLVFLGLPANIANGTNRLGVLFQSFIGYYTFKKNKLVISEGAAWMIIPAVIGAVIGATLAIDLDARSMNLAMGTLMIVLLVLVLLKPKQWLSFQKPDITRIKSIKTILIFFLVGLHGGFIQAGVGILLLSAMVLGAGFSLHYANGIKLLIVLAFTLPAFMLFVYNGQVNWFWAILLTIGQSLGGYLAANFASQYPQANIWVRRVLIVVILVAIVKFFHLYFFTFT